VSAKSRLGFRIRKLQPSGTYASYLENGVSKSGFGYLNQENRDAAIISGPHTDYFKYISPHLLMASFFQP